MRTIDPTYSARTTRSALRLLAAGALALAFSACPDEGPTSKPYQDDPAVGATSFVSAAGIPTSDRGAEYDAPTLGGVDDGTNDRTVEEGDIYRAMGDGLVVNLNRYRGVQILDLGDPDDPALVGAVRIAGDPVELYVQGDTIIALMNHWLGYYGVADDAAFSAAEGGAIVVIDASDPAAPAIVDHETVRGFIRTSRMVTGGGNAALYVAAAMYGWYGGGGVAVPVDAATDTASADETVVKSFSLAGGQLSAVTELDLGGWISDIQATPQALLVARSGTDGHSDVAVIDISDPGGAMVRGADVAVHGQVESQFNMDLRGDVLRVVSGGRWGASETNHLETFDVSDIQSPQPIDSETFGDGEQLYATLFVGNSAFFVTYFVQDPFHAFEITDAGEATERAEFVVSGWNDFFRATLGDTRLVGLGVDDAGSGRTVSVSLYDITDLTSPEPLVARADVGLQSSWSEANWDHRAFNVLEGAVDVLAPDGATVETGLVLVPYSGWAADEPYGLQSGVQVFTFSATTLTARGKMTHDTPVRRSFLSGPDTAANLSDTTLALHDVSDPDAPVALGSLDLAPSYSQLLRFGTYWVRLKSTTDTWWYDQADTDATWTLEVVSGADHPDTGAAVATVEIPANAAVYQAGDRLVAVSARTDPNAPEGEQITTTIAAWDMTDPAQPVAAGTLTTTDLETTWSGGWWGPEMAPAAADAAPWPIWTAPPQAKVAGDALVFVEATWRSEVTGSRTVCVTRPVGAGSTTPGDPDRPVPDTGGATPAAADGEAESPAWYTGAIECVQVEGGEPWCSGAIYRCTTDDCVAVDPGSVSTEEQCTTSPVEQWWQSYTLTPLPLDQDELALGEPIALPAADRGVLTLANGSDLWVSFARGAEVPGDPRPYVKYYVRSVDLSDPAAPVTGTPVNVPGVLLAVDGDELTTQDFVYNGSLVESAVSRVRLTGLGTAVLEARHRFGQREVRAVLPDGAGHVLVTHAAAWSPAVGYDGEDAQMVKLTVLEHAQFGELATVDVHAWASLDGATAGRALLRVPGGLLVMNLDTPSAPWPQAFFATLGWPQRVQIVAGDIVFAAGRYGIYRFPLDATNLLAPPAD